MRTAQIGPDLRLAFDMNSYGHCSFSVAAPLLWSSPPQHLGVLDHWTFLKDC